MARQERNAAPQRIRWRGLRIPLAAVPASQRRNWTVRPDATVTPLAPGMRPSQPSVPVTHPTESALPALQQVSSTAPATETAPDLATSERLAPAKPATTVQAAGELPTLIPTTVRSVPAPALPAEPMASKQYAVPYVAVEDSSLPLTQKAHDRRKTAAVWIFGALVGLFTLFWTVMAFAGHLITSSLGN